MHHHQLLIFFALLVFAFGLVSLIAEKKSVTGPMVFMTVGILGSSLAFGFLHVTLEMGPVKLVAELALTLVLFIDATLIDKSVLVGASHRIPTSLLLVGLPLRRRQHNSRERCQNSLQRYSDSRAGDPLYIYRSRHG